MKRVLIGVGIVLLLAGCSAPRTAQQSPTPTASVNYSELPAEFLGNGSFVAGVDMQPGTYLVVEEHATCEWFLGRDGKLIGSGSNDVVVEAGETVEVSGCSMFELAR